MAAAEARTAWQRAANRCLVQEDAKRAPKLACCSSASPSLKQVDSGPANGADAQNPSGTCFLPFNRNSSYCDLSPNSRWWLHLQPNYGYQKGLVSELVDSMEAEMENIGPVVDSIYKYNKSCDQNEADSSCVDKITLGGSLDSQVARYANHVSNDLGVGSKELTDVCTEISKDSLNLEDTGYPYEASKKGLVDFTVGKLVDEHSFDTGYPWIGVEKTEPWWRTADTEELALLVAKRSHDFMENCDLPQPQNNFVKQDHDVDVDSKIYAASMGLKAGSMHQDNTNIHKRAYLMILRRTFLLVHSLKNSDTPSQKIMPEMNISGDDESKAQLLKALRHSQTRAREAENAAKQAFAEKEHVVQLVFRQASQLFAYKQWFQLLQLENFYIQIKNHKKKPISAILPVMLPCLPQKTKRPQKKSARAKRAKRARPKYDLSRYAVVFALGLGLVGAGLLLGWSVGWMLPTF